MSTAGLTTSVSKRTVMRTHVQVVSVEDKSCWTTPYLLRISPKSGLVTQVRVVAWWWGSEVISALHGKTTFQVLDLLGSSSRGSTSTECRLIPGGPNPAQREMNMSGEAVV